MWIGKTVWEQLHTQRAQQLMYLEHQLVIERAATAESGKTLMQYHRLLIAAEQRVALAESKAAAAQTLADAFTIRVNQLQSERDQLLIQVVPNLKIATPHVGHLPVIEPPGISFSDMGDEAADITGQRDLSTEPPITSPDGIEGLVGEVVRPSP